MTICKRKVTTATPIDASFCEISFCHMEAVGLVLIGLPLKLYQALSKHCHAVSAAFMDDLNPMLSSEQCSLSSLGLIPISRNKPLHALLSELTVPFLKFYDEILLSHLFGLHFQF